MIDREAAINAAQQKLLDLFAELDPWDDEEELRGDAEAIVDAVLNGAAGD